MTRLLWLLCVHALLPCTQDTDDLDHIISSRAPAQNCCGNRLLNLNQNTSEHSVCVFQARDFDTVHLEGSGDFDGQPGSAAAATKASSDASGDVASVYNVTTAVLGLLNKLEDSLRVSADCNTSPRDLEALQTVKKDFKAFSATLVRMCDRDCLEDYPYMNSSSLGNINGQVITLYCCTLFTMQLFLG